MIYDMIVGAGAPSLSAAIYGARAEKGACS